eukprot:TRINITY_DN1417_c0_g1_i5.p1 TRINITY_DN1417_c0_g1~~TRINITY_DN1417_c0_g1_i5.p1  ORF type:complete len:263 (+),score=15.44 TRINITY_DN1417_c0_g1_i5:72-860(+)
MGACAACQKSDHPGSKENVNIESKPRKKSGYSTKPWKIFAKRQQQIDGTSDETKTPYSHRNAVWQPLDLPNFAEVDEYASKCPSETANDVDNLTSYLAKAEFTDLQKCRAIFYWIAQNIKYDQALKKKDLRSEEVKEGCNPNIVLRRRESVCGGYSNLFQAMAEKLGLNSLIVPGEARNKDGLSSHAWNMVLINDTWQLVDSTWASQAREQGDRRCYEYYFFMDPSELIFTHFPNDPKHQLLETPITREEFNSYPTFAPSIF